MNKLYGYIHTYEEAMLIVHAVRLKYLTPISERLTLEERESIKSGDIYCFIETDKGIKRWTDGKVWSPSKINGQFLLYMEVPKHMNKSAIEKRNQQRYMLGITAKSPRKDRSGDLEEKLNFHKKTVSIIYSGKTYHVIAYFRPMFANESIMNIPFFHDLHRALLNYPELLDDSIIKNIVNDNEARRSYELPQNTNESILPAVKRKGLEEIAGYVLTEWKQAKYRMKGYVEKK